MKRKVLILVATMGIVFGNFAAATPSYAAGDCGIPIEAMNWCYLDNAAYLLGNNNLGGGINISPRYKMVKLP
jgi:hypothetical protein